MATNSQLNSKAVADDTQGDSSAKGVDAPKNPIEKNEKKTAEASTTDSEVKDVVVQLEGSGSIEGADGPNKDLIAKEASEGKKVGVADKKDQDLPAADQAKEVPEKRRPIGPKTPPGTPPESSDDEDWSMPPPSKKPKAHAAKGYPVKK